MHNFIWRVPLLSVSTITKRSTFVSAAAGLIKQYRSEEASVGGLPLAYEFILVLIIYLPLLQVYVSSLFVHPT